MPALASGQPYGASAVLSAWSAYSLLAAVTGVNAGSWPAGGGAEVETSKHGGLGRGFLAYPSAVPDTVPPVVAVAVALLNRHRGRLGAAELAQRLRYARQNVHRHVSRHLGLPPRTLAQLLRFRAVAAAVRDGQEAQAGWAGLAAAGGYADQSHPHREFRALAGMTPAQALREWTEGRHSFNPATDSDRWCPCA